MTTSAVPMTRLSPALWAGLCQQQSDLPPLENIRRLGAKPQGWCVLRDGIAVAAVWAVLERPQQWHLVFGLLPGELEATEALLAHIAQHAQRCGVHHWRCTLPMASTTLAGVLKANGFRHVATQTQWKTVVNEAPTPVESAHPHWVLRLSHYKDTWPLYQIAQEACPIHARPYLMPWPPYWQRTLLGNIRRFLTGEFSKRWVLEDTRHPHEPTVVGQATITSCNYMAFNAQVTLCDGYDTAAQQLAEGVVHHACQHTQRPVLYWQTYSHQNAIEAWLTTTGSENLGSCLVLAKDVWTTQKPSVSKPFAGLLTPTEPLYGAGLPSNSHVNDAEPTA